MYFMKGTVDKELKLGSLSKKRKVNLSDCLMSSGLWILTLLLIPEQNPPILSIS